MHQNLLIFLKTSTKNCTTVKLEPCLNKHYFQHKCSVLRLLMGKFVQLNGRNIWNHMESYGTFNSNEHPVQFWFDGWKMTKICFVLFLPYWDRPWNQNKSTQYPGMGATNNNSRTTTSSSTTHQKQRQQQQQVLWLDQFWWIGFN